MQKMQRRLSLHLASSKIKRSANALLAKKMLMGLPLVTLFGHFETAPLCFSILFFLYFRQDRMFSLVNHGYCILCTNYPFPPGIKSSVIGSPGTPNHEPSSSSPVGAETLLYSRSGDKFSRSINPTFPSSVLT